MNLRNINIRKIIRFQFIAWIGTVVNLGALWLLHGQVGLAVPIAGAIAIELAIIHNFTWHYFVTWNTRVEHTFKNYMRLLIRYNLVTASIDFIVNLGILWSLNYFFGVHYLIADLIGKILGPVFKFLANEFVIFKEKHYGGAE